jgi:probable HAF family extracellular repeat protein
LPVIYGPRRNAIHALPLIAGDSSGAATALNDHGQVVGISGACDQAVGRHTALHAVLWDHGNAIDIGAGALTAPYWNTPTAINELGDVVGFAGEDEAGSITHAFLWTAARGIEFLNDVPGDNSNATAINIRGEVVGYYVAANGALHGFIWDRENGLRDLNDLKQSSYTNVLTLANDINDFGVITGRATDPATGTRYAFRAMP